MTGDVVNLRTFRKKKKREDKERKAAGNRAKFGRTKSEKLRDQAEDESLRRHVEDHRLGQSDEDHDDRT
ncbi:MAG: DUF4169 family protein [Pseudomonadota bacterium]